MLTSLCLALLAPMSNRGRRRNSESVGTDIVSIDVTKVLNETDVPGVRGVAQFSAEGQGRLKVFISYAREDERWRDKLEPNLGLLRREGLIDHWQDRDLVPSTETG